MIDIYKIDGAINNDPHKCFESEDTYPEFQEKLVFFKQLLIEFVENNESRTFYKYGDGDYYFLKKRRERSVSYPVLVLKLP